MALYQFTDVVPHADPSGNDLSVEVVASSLQNMAAAMSQVTNELAKATETLGRAKTLRASQAEIGTLLVRAQEFVDEMIRNAEEKSREIITVAQREASRLVNEASTQAAATVEKAAWTTSVRPEIMEQLSATIVGFGTINHQMAQDLTVLRESFAQMSEPASAPVSAVAPVPGVVRELATPVMAQHEQPQVIQPVLLEDPEPTIVGSASASPVSYWDRVPARRAPMSQPDPRRGKHLRRRRRRNPSDA